MSMPLQKLESCVCTVQAEAEASGAAAVKSEDAALKPGKVPAEHDAARQWAETLQFRQHVPPIVYASRTHSQLAQVIKELRATAYRCTACWAATRPCAQGTLRGAGGSAIAIHP